MNCTTTRQASWRLSLHVRRLCAMRTHGDARAGWNSEPGGMSGLPPRRPLKEPGVKALTPVVVFEERMLAPAQHRLLFVDVVTAQLAEQRAQALLDELGGGARRTARRSPHRTPKSLRGSHRGRTTRGGLRARPRSRVDRRRRAAMDRLAMRRPASSRRRTLSLSPSALVGCRRARRISAPLPLASLPENRLPVVITFGPHSIELLGGDADEDPGTTGYICIISGTATLREEVERR